LDWNCFLELFQAVRDLADISNDLVGSWLPGSREGFRKQRAATRRAFMLQLKLSLHP
jgi:hypothetical protein